LGRRARCAKKLKGRAEDRCQLRGFKNGHCQVIRKDSSRGSKSARGEREGVEKARALEALEV
jgi:hypothetical protein